MRLTTAADQILVKGLQSAPDPDERVLGSDGTIFGQTVLRRRGLAVCDLWEDVGGESWGS